MKSLENMFGALRAAGLPRKPSKLPFGRESVAYLNHVISAEGLAFEEDHPRATYPHLHQTSSFRFRGVGFCASFRAEFAEVTAPLVDLTRKEFATR